MSDEDLVLVSGASGYIATHIVQQLLEQGYRVRGTVRSLNEEAKVRPLRELCPGARHPLELVEADLLQSDTWLGAVAGCTLVLHTASPITLTPPEDEQELIRPAVDGVRAVLRAAAAAGTVRRVVLTSSIGAVSRGFDQGGMFNEENWTDVSPGTDPGAYNKSKTLSERAAWEYMTENPGAGFELAVVNPAVVMGPVLCGTLSTSMEIQKMLLEREISVLPQTALPIVDVRDVAAAHLKAMTSPEAAGKRHILSTETLTMKDMAEILKTEFGPLGYNVPTTNAPYWLAKIASWFDKGIQMSLPGWGKLTEFDTSRMQELLGIQPIAVRTSLIDMGHSLIQKGFVKETPEYKQPPK